MMLPSFAYLFIMDPVRLVTLERQFPGRAYPKYEEDEPGFAAPFLTAYIDALTDQAEHGLSHDLIQRIHRLSTSHLPEATPGQYRVSGGNFNINISSEEMTHATFHAPDYSATVKGIQAFIDYWLDTTKEYTTHTLVSSNKTHPTSGYFIKNQNGRLIMASVIDRHASHRVFDLSKKKDKQWLEALIRNPEYQHAIETMTDVEDGKIQILIQDIMNNIIRDFQVNILETNSDDEKIRIIATCVQRIAQCHPFHDGNTRTCYILLNKLLQYYALPLTLLNNPNYFDCCDMDYLVHAIKQGQTTLIALLHHHSTSDFEIKTDDSMPCLRSIICKPYDIGNPQLARRLCAAITRTRLPLEDINMDVCSATNEIMRAFDAKKHDKICEAIVRKDYALAFRNACVRKLYPLIMALMKHNDLLAFDLNAPSSNGNTALDWLDHHVPNPISDEHQAT